MSSSLRQPRAFVSALLLWVQLLGLGHVLLAEHTLSEDGGVVEVAPLLAERHLDRGGHLCADEGALREAGPADCLVLSGLRAPGLPTPAVAGGVAPETLAQGLTSPAQVCLQFDALSRAPKASPPQG